jgi:polyisoprenoid-binding protein YceI
MTIDRSSPAAGYCRIAGAAARRVIAALVATGAVLASSAGSAEPARFRVVPEQSRVEFVAGTQLGEFRGSTGLVSGDVVVDPASPSRPEIAIAVDARGLTSDNAKRDQHMHEKVLETAQFPAVRLLASAFRPDSGAAAPNGTLVGTLSLHGVDRQVTIPVRFERNGRTLRGDARFTIALADFRITPPRMLGLKVHDTVDIVVHLVASAP